MTVVAEPLQAERLTIADLLDRLDGIPASRIRLRPCPGTATERDVTHVLDRENIICELVEGTLVEKSIGLRESLLASLLLQYLGAFVRENKLGAVSAPDGTIRLPRGFVRAPDLAFFSHARLAGTRIRQEAIPEIVPDLAVEVLSEGNIHAEMARKRREYFDAGVRLVWMIDLDARAAQVYTAVDQSTHLKISDVLHGADVLPGFTLPLSRLFEDFDQQFIGPSR